MALLSMSAIFAQNSPANDFPQGFHIRSSTPQQLADAVSQALINHPENATLIVREAARELANPDGNFSDMEKKRVAALISATTAAAPSISREMIIAAGSGAIPALAGVIAEATDAVPIGKTNPTNQPDSGMVLGNIRVQEITGDGVLVIDAVGKASNLNAGDFLRQGVRIVTGPKGSAVLIFENGSLVLVNPNSEFSIDKFQQDPFDNKDINYTAIKDEPCRSITRTGVIKGEISFDVARLKKNSTYDIMTPVGIAGIRGTGGFVKSSPESQSQSASFGLFEGSATFTAASGQTQVVNQNQSIGVGGPVSNYVIKADPVDATTSLSQSKQDMVKARPETQRAPFTGAPPPVPVPPGPLSSLPAAQQQALMQSAEAGPQAIAATALQLAMQSPKNAADLAAAASDLTPIAATAISTSFASAFPTECAAIAAAISKSLPVLAPSIASSFAKARPELAPAIAAVVVTSAPNQALAVTRAVIASAPSQAEAVTAAVQDAVANSSAPAGDSAVSNNPPPIEAPQNTINNEVLIPTTTPTPIPEPSPTLKAQPVSPSA